MTVLQDVSREAMAKEIERLKAENEALKAKRGRAPSLSLKVSAKGAVSVYGLGKWPVTLYAGQWPKLLAISDDILEFIEDNQDSLKIKE